MAPAELPADYFDGHSPQAHPVSLSLDGQVLHIRGEGIALQFPVAALQWPERQRHGARLCYLPGEGLISHADGPAWDAWCAPVQTDSWVVRWMQSWRGAALAGLMTLMLLTLSWVWGVPLASQWLAMALPESLARSVGEQALAQLDAHGLASSRLPRPTQEALEADFRAAVQRAYPDGQAPDWHLVWRRSGRWQLGPNAFALPGGTLVMTDELARLLQDQPTVMLGVLAHELGHLRHRHGMRLVAQASLVSVLSTVVLGDSSGWVAAAPLVLSQQAYSRDAEREADQEAVTVLRANGWSPGVMVTLFERLEAARRKADIAAAADEAEDKPEPDTASPQPAPGWGLPIGLASHPSDAERIAFFQQQR
jgi:Zn-dependent protease with chaperone function